MTVSGSRRTEAVILGGRLIVMPAKAGIVPYRAGLDKGVAGGPPPTLTWVRRPGGSLVLAAVAITAFPGTAAQYPGASFTQTTRQPSGVFSRRLSDKFCTAMCSALSGPICKA